jgi:hypothetical protein
MSKFRLNAFAAALLLLSTTRVSAEDFPAVNNEGVTIYYKYLNGAGGSAVAVAYRGANIYSYPNTYTGNLIIPASVTNGGNTYDVTAIGEGAFSFCTALVSVSIPNTIMMIGDGAFASSGLTSVTIPDAVTSLGENAFSDCSSLTSVSIGNGVKTMGQSVFSNCSGLTLVTIGTAVTTIGDYAFSGCTGLGALTIPSKVTTIGKYAFSDCSDLTSVIIPDSVRTIGNNAFSACSRLASVIIGNGVKTIGEAAFSNCTELSSVIIGNAVTTIGNAAFSACSRLTLVKIPDAVTTIGEHAFSGCSGLTVVTIGNAVTTIGEYAFSDCSGLALLTIGNAVTTIGNYAFSDCSSLTSLLIPDAVTMIGAYAFRACSGLTTITIGIALATIYDYAFFGCSGLLSFEVKDANSNYSSDAQGILYNKLQTVLIQCPVGKTGEVTISDSLTTIGELAFSGCSGLPSITSLAITPPQLGTDAFNTVPTTIPIHVPCGAVAAYKAAAGWSDFSDYSGCITEVGIATSDVATAGIAVYPNPMQDVISIVLPENTTQASFRLYDMQGRLLLEQTLTADEKVVVSQLSSGIYLYNLNVNGERQIGKIVKQ